MSAIMRPLCWLFGHDWKDLSYGRRVCRSCEKAQRRDDFMRWRDA